MRIDQPQIEPAIAFCGMVAGGGDQDLVMRAAVPPCIGCPAKVIGDDRRMPQEQHCCDRCIRLCCRIDHGGIAPRRGKSRDQRMGQGAVARAALLRVFGLQQPAMRARKTALL